MKILRGTLTAYNCLLKRVLDGDPGNLNIMALLSAAEDKYLMSPSVKLKESVSLLRSVGQKRQTSPCCCFVSHGHWFSCELFKIMFGLISKIDTV